MNMRKNIGLRLSQARKAKGLTQEQLAELASFSVSEISRIETGRAETPLTTLQKLCDVLQIGLDFLLYDCFPDKTGFTNPTIQQIMELLSSASEEEQKVCLEIIKQVHKLSDKNTHLKRMETSTVRQLGRSVRLSHFNRHKNSGDRSEFFSSL